MKQKEVFNKIGGIIQELSDQYEYLKTVQDDLNDLELELFVSNAHFLTDHIEILCKLNLQKNNVRRPFIEKLNAAPAAEHKFFEPVVQQMKNINDNAKPKPIKTPVADEKPEPVTAIAPEEQPVPQIDISSAAPADSYSLFRQEPEVIRHEIVLDKSIEIEDIEPDAPEVTEEKAEEITLEITEEPAKAEEIETPLIAEEVVAEEPKTEETVAEEVKPEAKEEPAKADEPAKKADDDVQTINQKMQAQLGDKANSKTDQLAIKPISDIKLAITLNDKLLYVKDLFNGYNLAYSEAIEILNRFSSFEEAQRFLKTNYVTKNNWESKPATTEKFYALLKRRYA